MSSHIPLVLCWCAPTVVVFVKSAVRVKRRKRLCCACFRSMPVVWSVVGSKLQVTWRPLFLTAATAAASDNVCLHRPSSLGRYTAVTSCRSLPYFQFMTIVGEL